MVFGSSGTGNAQAFGQEVSRDKVIEYLLSLCTGVVFSRKTFTSHYQNVRNTLGFQDSGPPSAYLRSLMEGFEVEFPKEQNPMTAELDYITSFYTRKSRNGRCPLILPPVLAVILEPVPSELDIDWNRMQSCFIFSEGTVQPVVTQHWTWYTKQCRILRAAAKKAKQAEEDKGTSKKAKPPGKKKPAVRKASAKQGSATKKPSSLRTASSRSSSSQASTDTDDSSRCRPYDRKVRLDVGSGSSSVTETEMTAQRGLTEQAEMCSAASTLYEMANVHPLSELPLGIRSGSAFTTSGPVPASTTAVDFRSPVIPLRLSFETSFARGSR